jgi:hypothetical protein
LYVNQSTWYAHQSRVAAENPGLVPVVKGNGYGFTLPVLAQAAARLGAAAGVDQVAVGTVREAQSLLAHYPHEMIVLEPYFPAAEGSALPERVIRTAGSVDAVRRLAGQRMLIECRSSLSRQGLPRESLSEVRAALGPTRAEGFSLHLPIDRPAGTDAMREVTDWVNTLVEAGFNVPRMYVSHLTRTETDVLTARFPRTRFRLRVGTKLWLGEPSALEARATVLDVIPVAEGQRIGYRQARTRHGGWIIVVSGGTVQGIGLDAPKLYRGLQPRIRELVRSGARLTNRTLSPFWWQGRQQWFAEPPHMSVSMIHLGPSGEPPEVGGELYARVSHTRTHFDRVVLHEEPGPRPIIVTDAAGRARSNRAPSNRATPTPTGCAAAGTDH